MVQERTTVAHRTLGSRLAILSTPAAILVLALLVRIACILAFQTHLGCDEIESGAIAKNIVEGDGYSLEYFAPERPTAAFPPVEPLVLAGVHGLLGYTDFSYFVVVLLRSILSVLTAYIVYRAVSPIFGATLAKAMLVVVAFHPAFIYYSSIAALLTRPPFSMFTMSLVVWSAVVFAHRPSFGRAILFGMAGGVGCLVEERVLLVVLVMSLWLLWHLRQRLTFAPRLARIAVVVLALLVTISPWTIRSSLLFGELVLLRSDQWTLFWIGNNPVATGDYSQITGPIQNHMDIVPVRELPAQVREEIAQAGELERDHIFKALAWDFVRENPGRFAELTLHRLAFFWFGPMKDRQSSAKSLVDLAYRIYSIVVVTGVLASLFLLRSRFTIFFLIPIAVYTLVHGIAHAGMFYYRMPVEPYALMMGIESARRVVMKIRGAAAPSGLATNESSAQRTFDASDEETDKFAYR